MRIKNKFKCFFKVESGTSVQNMLRVNSEWPFADRPAGWAPSGEGQPEEPEIGLVGRSPPLGAHSRGTTEPLEAVSFRSFFPPTLCCFFFSCSIGLYKRVVRGWCCFKPNSNPMDLEDEAGATENSGGVELVDCEGDPIVEPCEGMEFDSEDAAKIFYDEYARRVGFVMRVMSCRRSERDGKILARRLGCNKEGYCVSIRGKFGPVRKPRASTREGCKAMIHVKVDRSGKWVITKFVKEHNHPLVISPREARQTMDEKDKKIQELTAELRNKKRLCAAYQEQLTAFKIRTCGPGPYEEKLASAYR
ncbi:hypothetical protein NL676_019299 [Syzygium grande]|nr:hypothetical protein NL676_019299 [Syzygium grande]